MPDQFWQMRTVVSSCLTPPTGPPTVRDDVQISDRPMIGSRAAAVAYLDALVAGRAAALAAEGWVMTDRSPLSVTYEWQTPATAHPASGYRVVVCRYVLERC